MHMTLTSNLANIEQNIFYFKPLLNDYMCAYFPRWEQGIAKNNNTIQEFGGFKRIFTNPLLCLVMH